MLAKLLALFLTFLSLGQGAVDAYVQEMNLGGNLILVNQTYLLPSTYVPEDLVKPKVQATVSNIKMRAEAATALEEMFAAAKAEKNYTLVAVSGYRSYGQQATLYGNKVESAGKKQKLVAPPGASEHQLGLAMDLGCKKNTGLTSSFGKTDEGKWVEENAHRFGYIIRYKAEWAEITGYEEEPWHVRYVGVEHATRIYELDIPFEQYVQQLREAQYALLTAKE